MPHLTKQWFHYTTVSNCLHGKIGELEFGGLDNLNNLNQDYNLWVFYGDKLLQQRNINYINYSWNHGNDL